MKKFLFALLIFLCGLIPASAQRKYQPLNRGVVAVNNGTSSSSQVFVSWRLLAQESDSVTFNLYCQEGGSGAYQLLNAEPLSKTCYTTTIAKIPNKSQLAVTSITGGVESEKSLPFTFTARSYRSLFLELYYDDFLPQDQYSTKFIWPADLDGDGEYDYVVDRVSLVDSLDSKVEAYLRTGERLWTIDMGPNVQISVGHDDMVLAYDMDCNGFSDVVIKSSDGTRFWDKEKNTWGKYLLGKSTADSDGDGIIDYNTQSTYNPPQYITVVDGLTGAEKSTVEMPYPSDASHAYKRNNKADYMGGGYNLLTGHMAVAYIDGIHPSVVMEYCCRVSSGYHYYYVTGWGYDFVNGKATDFVQKFHWNRDHQDCAEFHHIRIADVDMDGMDEVLDGGFGLNGDGTLAFNAHLSHGDRFRVGDLNPSRPGLETYAIQQNAANMLGQLLYDSRTGTHLKDLYLSAVGDVGRGDCIDIDPDHKGYEFWSTMGNVYDCEGNITYKGGVDQPKEGVWWDGDAGREILSAVDGNGANAMICKSNANASFQYNRLIELSKMMGWTVHSEYGVRPAFFGDIMGDWREEILLERTAVSGDVTKYVGFCGFTTDYDTDIRLYCLMQNAAYRMQTTTKGYYQSAYPDYYLGYDMSQPPLPPFMVADYVWTKGNEWSSSTSFNNYEENVVQYADGKSVLFDISGDNKDTIQLSGNLSPAVLYIMAPEEHNYIFGGNGKITGATELWKSQNGKLVINGDYDYTGKTVISEGTLEWNGSLKSPVYIKALGTLSGNATLDGGLDVTAGLHYEGGRIAPGKAGEAGKIVLNKDFSISGGVYFEMDTNDSLIIHGNFTASGHNYIHIISTEVSEGKYPLISWDGTFTGVTSHFDIMGLSGLSKKLSVEDNTLYLSIYGQREAKDSVIWMGGTSAQWDYSADNFSIHAENTPFVNNDTVYFNDQASQRDVQIPESVYPGYIYVDNEDAAYTLSGEGIAGTGGLLKKGAATLFLSSDKNTFTGSVSIESGTVQVTSLGKIGEASSLGAGNNRANSLRISNAELLVNSVNTITDRPVSLNGEAIINAYQSGSSVYFSGNISGTGKLIKNGPGQLTFGSSANTYSGGTIINNGILAMGTYDTRFGASGSAIQAYGNSKIVIFDNNSTSQVPVFNHALTVNSGSNLYMSAGTRCKLNGKLSGSGNLTLNIPYVRTDLIGNWSDFSGVLSVTGRDFRLCNANGLPNAAVHLSNGVTMGHWKEGSGTAQSLTSKIGSLNGVAGSYLSNGTYYVGYDNRDAVFAGVINAGVSIQKFGTGSWTLSGSNLLTSTVTVNAGTLIAANTEGSATGSGTVNIASGATLEGTGIIAGSVVAKTGSEIKGTNTYQASLTLNEGAKMYVGDSASYTPGTVTVKNLTLAKGSILEMDIIGGISKKRDNITISGTFTPAGTLILRKISALTLKAGYAFELFSFTNAPTSTFDSISLPEIGNELAWDTSLLYTDGIISVIAVSALDEAKGNRLITTSYSRTDQVLHIITGPFEGNGQLELYHTSGELVMHCQIASNENKQIDLSGISQGVYILRFTAISQQSTIKITVN